MERLTGQMKACYQEDEGYYKRRVVIIAKICNVCSAMHSCTPPLCHRPWCQARVKRKWSYSVERHEME